MIHRVIPAIVKDGQFHIQESLSELEGREVMLRVEDPTVTVSELPRLQPSPFHDDDVEIELFIHSPFRRDVVTGVVRDGGRLAPCLIFPEACRPEEDEDE
jgi:hypothetical protein